jgi:uncharacterized repeat protein (TIGR01451 family)
LPAISLEAIDGTSPMRGLGLEGTGSERRLNILVTASVTMRGTRVSRLTRRLPMHAPTTTRLASIGLLVIALVGVSLLATAAPARAAAPFGGAVVQLNQDATTLDQNETTIAINPTNPRNLVAGSITNETGIGQCGAYASTDRGKTWSHQVMPNAPGFTFGGDPIVGFDLNGTAYFLCLNLNRDASGNAIQHTQYVFRSTDGGQTWVGPVLAIGTAMANTDDKGHLAVDDHATSPFVGNVYVANTRLNTGKIRFARSIDSGQSFLPDQPVNDSDIGFPANIAVGADGAVYVSWAREVTGSPGQSVAIMIDKSTDGGATFGALTGGTDHQIKAGGVVDGGEVRALPLRGNGSPNLGTNPFAANIVYAVWAEDAPGIDDSDVMFSRSVDGGNTWQPPIRVNHDVNPAGEFFSQFWPTMAVDPADGEIDIAWYSDENDPNRADGTPLIDLYFASSTDGGLSFGPSLRVSSPSTIPVGFFGDYIGIDALGGVAHPIWTDSTLGGQGDQDAATTQIGGADLRIAKSDSSDPVVAGRNLIYTIDVTNDGPADARGVIVSDTLPSGVTYVADTGSCAQGPGPGMLTCYLGDLRSGATRTFTVTVRVAADLVYSSGGPVTMSNAVSVDSDQDDPAPANNADSESTQVVARADIEIVSFAAQLPPTQLLVGDTANVMLRKVITNNGPSGPTDVGIAVTAAATGGGSVAPASASATELALDVGETRSVDEPFTVGCGAPGPASFTFTNQVTTTSPGTTDPLLANNVATATFSVACIIPVQINIKPGSLTNPIQVGSLGSTPVAILTTIAGEYGLPVAVDATNVDPSSVRFGPSDLVLAGGGALAPKGRGHLEDSFELDEKTHDGDLDMVLQFDTQASGLEMGDTEACLVGTLTSGGATYAFMGCDLVTMVP